MNKYRYFKYRAINKYSIDSLVKGTLYFAPPADLNDPFDCRINLEQSIKNALKSSDEEREKALNKLLSDRTLLNRIPSKINDQVGICSFSLNMKETLMWSHYADNHKGMCLLYEIPEGFINEPSNKIIGISKVSYKKNNITNWLKKFDLNLMTLSSYRLAYAILKELLTSKSPSWSYEEEARIIKDGYGNLEIPRPFLRQICFGLNTSKEDIQLIRKIISSYSNEVRFCQTIRANSDFGIDLKEI